LIRAMKTHHRIERVSQLLREILSEIILFRVKDPRVKDVVVTHLKVSGDLSTCSVYFRLLDEKGDVEGVKNGLERAESFIRSEVSKEIRLKKIPFFRFFYDTQIDQAMRVESILKDLNHH